MKIAVLSSATAWHFLDLKRACGDQHELFNFRFQELAASLEQGGASFNLDADAVIVRTMPGGSLQQVVFRMDLLAQLERTGTIVVNPAKSIEAAVDKYLSLAKIKAAGIPVPRTFVSQTVEAAFLHFKGLDEDVVAKPIFGSMGRGIVRLQSNGEAKTHFEEMVEAGEVIYQQEFLRHSGFDIRLFVIGEKVFAMKRTNTKGWITNISQGGVGECYQASDQERCLAIGAARAVGARIAGVDLLYDESGKPYILEVNAVPGWEAISSVLQIDFAKLILEEVTGLELV